MDPITLAIVAAITAGITSGLTNGFAKTSEQILVDAYSELKQLLQKKFGVESKLIKAIDDLEANPKSEGRKNTLREEIVSAQAETDPDLINISQLLINKLKSDPEKAQVLQQAIGNNIAQASDGSTASVNISQPK